MRRETVTDQDRVAKRPPGRDPFSKHLEIAMYRRQPSGARNKLDLTDRVQVRILRKRLKVSDEQLVNLVRTAGNSIAAVRKEVGARRLLTLPGAPLSPAK